LEEGARIWIELLLNAMLELSTETLHAAWIVTPLILAAAVSNVAVRASDAAFLCSQTMR
jgi:hypothetical protein